MQQMLNCTIGGCVEMLVSNEKKFIYLRVPKTGSTSVSVYFYENLPLEENIIRLVDNSDVLRKDESSKIKDGYFNESAITTTNGIHATLDEIVKLNLLTYPLTEYDIYAVCRNPLDRFLSFQSMLKKVENVNILENFSTFKCYMNMFQASPQSTWLNYNNRLVNRVFLYENIDLMVSEIAEKYGITNTSNFSNYSFRQYKKYTSIVDPRALDYINTYWQDDFKIYDLLKSAL
jgi:hypothetical protein